MKLETEIKQKKFKDVYHKLAVNIIYTHSWLTSHQSEILCKYKITTQQYNILRILRGQYPDPVTINELKERMLDKMSDASRLVERLRLKGLVDRQSNSADRRRADVKILKQGLKILEEMDDIEVHLKKVLSNITEKEADVVNEILDKMRG